MTPADYERLRRYCAKVWKSHGGGMRDDLAEDHFQNVVLAILEGDVEDRPLADVAVGLARDMGRDEEKQQQCAIQAAFEHHGDALPAHVSVPHHNGWGGSRKGAGRPRKAAA